MVAVGMIAYAFFEAALAALVVAPLITPVRCSKKAVYYMLTRPIFTFNV